MPIATVNPATGETLRTFDPLTRAEIDDRLSRARRAFEAHRLSSFEERARCMLRAAAMLTADKNRLGALMTIEMGKPLSAAVAEAEKCAKACSYYAENAERLLARLEIETEDGESSVHFQPLGVVLAVMPWNFPFWQVFRFIAPAVMAGNTGLLKHSSNVPQCALAIEDIMRRAGFADGVFQSLLIGSGEIEAIIEDDRISAVTLTGSEAAGRSVAGIAGKNLRKTVLELGGSDPFVVMPSADVETAGATAVKARMINNGQSCIAAKRFIVHAKVYDEFLDRFVTLVRSLAVGDPMSASTDIGPLATSEIRDELATQVDRTVELGARVLCGAKKRDGPGFFYEPTVLVDIPAASPAATEELFGPVASVWKVADMDEALNVANDTRFGLGASVWTNDAKEREHFIRDIESGMVFINGMVASEPGLPFGGVKASGYGRELGEFGIREFVNIKAVKRSGEGRKLSDTE